MTSPSGSFPGAGERAGRASDLIDPEFLEKVADDLNRLQGRVEEAAGETPDYPDLEALLRLAWLEARRQAKWAAEVVAVTAGDRLADGRECSAPNPPVEDAPLERES